MKKYIVLFSIPLLGLLISGCDLPEDIATENTSDTYVLESEESISAETSDEENEAQMIFNSTSIQISGSGVQASGSVATITMPGIYTASGDLTGGSIIIDADDTDVTLILNGVNITSNNGPAIYGKNAQDIKIILAENSENILTDSTSYADFASDENSPNGVIFTTSDLKIKGESGSSLVITANYKDGIVSKDDLDIDDVSITVTAPDDGIRGKDSLSIKDSTVDVFVEGDALRSDNTDEQRGVITIEDSSITIEAGDDAIHGVNIVEVVSGNIVITDSYEGLESKKITIHDGIVDVTARDDALNVAEKKEDSEEGVFGFGGGRGGGMSVLEGGELNIYGGEIILNSGGDGFDSNGHAVMTGGSLTIHGPTQSMNGAIDVNGEFMVSGGDLIAIGSVGMAETPSSDSEQYSLQFNLESSEPAGTLIEIRNGSEDTMKTLVSEKQFQSVTYSSPEVEMGGVYSLFINGEFVADITVDQKVSTYGSGNRMGPGGGGGGGPRDRGDFSTSGDMNPPMMDMELPENWDEMTQDEQRAYMDANRPTPSEEFGGMPPMMDMELPENWDDMTQDEQRAYMDANRPTPPEGFGGMPPQ